MKKVDRFEKTIQKIRLTTFVLSSLLLLYQIKEEGSISLLNVTTMADESTDNIYDENQLTITETEKEAIKEKLEAKLGYKISSSNKEETQNNYLLLNAIYENSHLTEDEKMIFYNLIDLIKETPHPNKEDTYHTLKTIECVLSKEEPPEAMTARYNDFKNEIEYFNINPSYYELSHEDIHGIFRSTKLINTMPQFLKEGMAELLSREYVGTDPYSPFHSDFYDNTSIVYQPEITSVKLLCELVGVEKMKEAYARDDVDILYSALADNYKDKKEARKLITGLEDLINKLKRNGYLEPLEQEKKIFTLLEEYKENSVAFPKDDFISQPACSYYIDLLKCMYGPDYVEKVESFIRENGLFERAYFCEALKEDASNNFISYADRPIYRNGRSYEKKIAKIK